MTLPKRYENELREHTNQVEYQVSPKTREIMHEIMKQNDFPGSTDLQTLGLLYNMIILTKSAKVLQLELGLDFLAL